MMLPAKICFEAWTFQAAMSDVRAQEYGLQLYKDNKEKYEIVAKEDWYNKA